MNWSKILSSGLAPLSLSFALFSCAEKEVVPGELNILFISIDDLRPELNCYGTRHILSPNIDRLAEQGVLFERAYCQQAICMASRASLFTGYHAASNRIYTTLSVSELMPDVLTLNKFFSNKGYDVFGIGKLYHYNEDHLEQFGETWRKNRTWEGDRTVGGYLTPEAISQRGESGGLVKGPAWEITDAEDNDYRDGFYADWVVRKLGELKNAENPFFMGVGFHKPHLPFNAPRKYWEMYDSDQIFTADNPFYPVNGSPYGITGYGELRNYSNIPTDRNVPIPEDIQKMLIHGYFACVTYVDALVGKILDALEENGLAENTVVVLWGDHGWKLGEHGLWCKHSNFELDARVPLIISAPGMKKNAKTKSFAEIVDLFPTLADLCGFEIPEHLDGNSLVPVLKDPSHKVKEHAYTIWPSYMGDRYDKERLIQGYSVRTDNYRYNEWIHVNSGEIMDRELYDLGKDPKQNENVISDKQYTEELPALEELIRDYIMMYTREEFVSLIQSN